MKWHNWEGGVNPCLSKRDIVRVQFRSGKVATYFSFQLCWWHDGRDPDNDIVKYQVVEQVAV